MIKKNKTFIFLLLILLVVRLLFVFSNFENLSWFEESYNGGIAVEILNGLKMPLFFYQHQPYAPGAMIMGIAAVPFYWLFGESYLSLKMLALFVTLLIFTCWYFLVKRVSGGKVALFFSLLFIIAPPNSMKSSLYSLGNHYESALFTALVLYLFVAGVYEKKKDTDISLLSVALAGLVCGFATYFVLTFLVTVCLVMLFWLLKDRLFFVKKPFFVFSGMFTVGFLPWIYNLIRYSDKVLDFHGTPIYLVTKSESYFAKALRYFSTGIPISLGFEGIKGKNIDAYAYYFILIIASFVFYFALKEGYFESVKNIFSKSGKYNDKTIIRGEMVLGFFPLIYTAIYIFSQFPLPKKYLSFFKFSFRDVYNFIAYRYFFPLYPFFFFIIAYSAVKLISGEGLFKKLSGYAMIGVCLACTLFGFYRDVSNPDWFRGRFYAGSDYNIIGRKIADYCGEDAGLMYGKLSGVPRQYRIVTFRGAGEQIGIDSDDYSLLASLQKKCKGEEKKWINEGFAKGFFEKCRYDRESETFSFSKGDIDVKALIKEVSAEYRPLYYRNMGKIVAYLCNFSTSDKISESLRILSNAREKYSASFEDLNIRTMNLSPEAFNMKISEEGEGVGEYVYSAVGRVLAPLPFVSEKEFLNWYEKTDARYTDALLKGMSGKSAFYFYRNFPRAVIALKRIPTEYRGYFVAAAGEAFFWKYWYSMKDIKKGNKSFPFEDDKYFYRGIGRGIGYLLWWDEPFREKFISLIDEKYRNYCVMGIDERIGETYDLTFQNSFKYFRINAG